jgi:hypothetical protein
MLELLASYGRIPVTWLGVQERRLALGNTRQYPRYHDTGHGMAQVCQIGYCTHTRGTHLSGTAGLPVPLFKPSFTLLFLAALLTNRIKVVFPEDSDTTHTSNIVYTEVLIGLPNTDTT